MSNVSEKVRELLGHVEGYVHRDLHSLIADVQALERQLDEALGRERVSQATYDKQSEAYVEALRERDARERQFQEKVAQVVQLMDERNEARARVQELERLNLTFAQREQDDVLVQQALDAKAQLAEVRAELAQRRARGEAWEWVKDLERPAAIRQAKREAYIAALVLGPEEIRKRLDELNEEET